MLHFLQGNEITLTSYILPVTGHSRYSLLLLLLFRMWFGTLPPAGKQAAESQTTVKPQINIICLQVDQLPDMQLGKLFRD